jgi:hypothetical protein
MLKSEAIGALGGTVAAAAREIGITPQAVGQWPDELPPAIRDRVQAALWRRERGAERAAPPIPEPAAQEAA